MKGYGDIAPRNNTERMVAIVIIFLGTCMFNYLIVNVVKFAIADDKIKTFQEDTREAVELFSLKVKSLTHKKHTHPQSVIFGLIPSFFFVFEVRVFFFGLFCR